MKLFNDLGKQQDELDEIFKVTEIEGKLKSSLVGARQGCVVHIVTEEKEQEERNDTPRPG